jgi:response regulator of citrate/malate metabolism
MIRTLVVDDDYRVADVNAAFVERVPGFAVCGRARTAAEAYRLVEGGRPDLVLLDLYLPDEHGLALMRRLQDLGPAPDVMVISAARDVDSIRTSLQLGAVHYLVKPFTFARLSERLTAYRELRAGLDRIDEASQDDVDQLYALLRSPSMPARLPKGHSLPTMTRILDALRAGSGELTAAEVADEVGISRPTAQRYLVQLVRSGLVALDLQYGATGRPAHRYRMVAPRLEGR